MTSFNDFALEPSLKKNLEKIHFTTPTPIQEKAIPVALEGRDILGSAQTGTGKTGAYAIPLVQFLISNPGASALVLAPTRELARQVMDNIRAMLGRDGGIKMAFLIGGVAMGPQFNQLRANPRIIIGTPGRVNDHLDRGSLSLKTASFLVLDETDRMLDMGFDVQLERIFKFMPRERQTLMFSATLPKPIIKMSEKYLRDPVRLSVGETHVASAQIQQDVIHVSEEEKYDALLDQLEQRNGSVIIFVKTKYGTERLAKRLERANHTADVIHGDLKQSRRDRVIRDFRARGYRILVATDVAARGLDIPHIEHVINYDLPQVAEDYIHRIGRTGRAGATGSALCLITPADKLKWRAIDKLMNPDKFQANDDADRRGGNGAKKPRRRFGGGRGAGGGGNRNNGSGAGKRDRFGGARDTAPGVKRRFAGGRR